MLYLSSPILVYRISPPPTPTTQLTSPNTNLSERNLIQTALAALTPGSALHNIPTEMYVGQPELIEVRITDDLQRTLTSDLTGRGQPQTATISVSTYMTVALTGNEDAFKIKQQHLNSTQIVMGTTEWSWIITPLKSGTHLLQLQVFAKITLGDEQQEKNVSVLKREIHVKTTITHTLQMFITSYWQWIATTLAIPLVGWLWNKYRSRADTQHQEKPKSTKRKGKPQGQR